MSIGTIKGVFEDFFNRMPTRSKKEVEEEKTKRELLEEEYIRIKELNGRYEKVLELLTSDITEMINQSAKTEQRVTEMEKALLGKSYLVVYRTFQDHGSSIIDNFDSRISMLEANLPNHVLNKQHILRLLGINEERAKLLLEAANVTEEQT